MSKYNADTIFALASGEHSSAIAIFRVSGPATKSVLKKITGVVPVPRLATLANFKNEKGFVFDQGIVIFFPKPNSFTGEDLGEVQVHGGLGIKQIFSKTCLALSKKNKIIRFADPGEFSRRAFFNEKINLLEAECIADLINAETEKKVEAVATVVAGDFGQEVLKLGRSITKIRGELEARIDFSEEDVGEIDKEVLKKQIDDEVNWITNILKKARKGAVVSKPYTVSVVGLVNVGKSTLVNLLSGEDVSIVHNRSGTTRDIVSVPIHLGCNFIKLSDTAGVRKAKTVVEEKGIKKGMSLAKKSDLVLVCIDSSKPHSLKKTLEKFNIQKSKALYVFTKADLREKNNIKIHNIGNSILVSSHTGEGLKELKNLVSQFFQSKVSKYNEAEVIFLRERVVVGLEKCKANFIRAIINLKMLSFDLAAEDLRMAQENLFEITGEISNEKVLDEIFSNFCIGK